MKKLSLLSAAALLAGTTLAMAASTMTPSAGGTPPGSNMAAKGKCWDAASNTVKDKSTQTASGQKKSGAVTTGSGVSGNASNSTGMAPKTRPAGMPSC